MEVVTCILVIFGSDCIYNHGHWTRWKLLQATLDCMQDLHVLLAWVEVTWHVHYIVKNMHMVCALYFIVFFFVHGFYLYPSCWLHWQQVSHMITPVLVQPPWKIWVYTSQKLTKANNITTTKQSTTEPCAYFMGYILLVDYHNNWGYSTLDQEAISQKFYELIIGILPNFWVL